MARVLLLFGGRSAEHDVSCTSAVAIHDALVEAGHRVIPVGIDRDGDWWIVDTTLQRDVGMPAFSNMLLAMSLSMASADGRTPHPTYGLPAISKTPCIVPSSPYGPWSTGNTTS